MDLKMDLKQQLIINRPSKNMMTYDLIDINGLSELKDILQILTNYSKDGHQIDMLKTAQDFQDYYNAISVEIVNSVERIRDMVPQ
jgi:hypothetical protein